MLLIRLKYGLHFNKPSYLLRLFSNLFRAKLYKTFGIQKFILRGIDFAVTYHCNFKCDHCYAEKLKNTKQNYLSPLEYSAICHQAMKLGCVCFSLQGGEVFVRKDWEDVVKAFQPKKNHILITTNGSLIDEEKICKLKDMGLDTLYFSVDSGVSEEHDAFRKHEGSFEKIMAAVELCKKHKIKVVFNTCITKQNYDSEGIKKIFEYSKRNFILVEAILARCLGNFDGQDNVMLDDDAFAKFSEIRKLYPFVVRDLDNNYGSWGCPAVKEVMYITAYGDVCPCPYSHVSLGNVRKESLESIRNRGLQSKWYDHYHKECLTARDSSFMKIYYPLVEEQSLISIKELDDASK